MNIDQLRSFLGDRKNLNSYKKEAVQNFFLDNPQSHNIHQVKEFLAVWELSNSGDQFDRDVCKTRIISDLIESVAVDFDDMNDLVLLVSDKNHRKTLGRKWILKSPDIEDNERQKINEICSSESASFSSSQTAESIIERLASPIENLISTFSDVKGDQNRYREIMKRKEIFDLSNLLGISNLSEALNYISDSAFRSQIVINLINETNNDEDRIKLLANAIKSDLYPKDDFSVERALDSTACRGLRGKLFELILVDDDLLSSSSSVKSDLKEEKIYDFEDELVPLQNPSSSFLSNQSEAIKSLKLPPIGRGVK